VSAATIPALLGVEAELELAGRDGAPAALARPPGRRLGRGALRVTLPDVVDAVWPAVSVTVLPPPAACARRSAARAGRPAVVEDA
jgi:hypothetical protein